MDRPYDVITFDCYGTLIDWEHGIRDAFAAQAAAARLPVDLDAALALYVEIEAAVEAEAYRSYRAVLTETARRMGMRPPSLYKHFPSLHAIYDALFARANARVVAYVEEAVQGLDHGLDRLLEGHRALIRWSMLNPGLAPLLFWRPIPGFAPSANHSS